MLKNIKGTPLRSVENDGEDVPQTQRRTRGVDFLGFDYVRLEPNERPEDLLQRIACLIDSSQLKENETILCSGQPWYATMHMGNIHSPKISKH